MLFHDCSLIKLLNIIKYIKALVVYIYIKKLKNHRKQILIAEMQ